MSNELLYYITYEIGPSGYPLRSYEPAHPTGRWKLVKPLGCDVCALFLELSIKETVGLWWTKREVEKTCWVSEERLVFLSAREEHVFTCGEQR